MAAHDAAPFTPHQPFVCRSASPPLLAHRLAGQFRSRALLRWFGSPLCNTQGGFNTPPSLVLVTAGVCNAVPGGSSYQVLCRGDRAGGAIRFCGAPGCGGGCSEVPFTNNMCLINLPGHGALSYDASCAPVGPWQTANFGVVQGVDDALIAGVDAPIVITTTAPLFYRRLEAQEGEGAGGDVADTGAAAAAAAPGAADGAPAAL